MKRFDLRTVAGALELFLGCFTEVLCTLNVVIALAILLIALQWCCTAHPIAIVTDFDLLTSQCSAINI